MSKEKKKTDQHVNEGVLDFIITANAPLNTVENVAFQWLFKGEEACQLITTTKMLHTLIGVRFQQFQKKTKN